MEVGDLVRHKSIHKHVGIIVKMVRRDLLIAWSDGDMSWAYKFQLEVINESR
jgi:hypothetical protein